MHSARGQARQVVTSQVPRSTCPRGLPVTLAPNKKKWQAPITFMPVFVDTSVGLRGQRGPSLSQLQAGI